MQPQSAPEQLTVAAPVSAAQQKGNAAVSGITGLVLTNAFER
jgi:hypothetical protein